VRHKMADWDRPARRERPLGELANERDDAEHEQVRSDGHDELCEKNSHLLVRVRALAKGLPLESRKMGGADSLFQRGASFITPGFNLSARAAF
jgi:hypothetical protein